jgi:hypothetical protein
LELQLLEDRGREPRELRLRDEEIGRRLFESRPPLSRHAAFRAWLEALHARDEPTPGRRLAAVYRLISWLLAVGGLCAGGSAAAGILYYDGRDPVNVISYLAVFVLLQQALIWLSILSMLPSGVRGRLLPLGPLQSVLHELGLRRAGIDAIAERMAGAAGAGGGRLRALTSIYAGAERWRLASMTQRSAFAFNLGALITSFAMVATKALAFSWSTTLDVGPEAMHRLFEAIALPWSWTGRAVPSLGLVQASRYFPGGHYDPSQLKDWWPFLLAALLTYGLIPRLLLWLVASRAALAARRGLTLDHGDARLAYQRLTRASSGWAAQSTADVEAAAPPVAAGADRRPASVSIEPGTACDVLVWGDAPIDERAATELLAVRFDARALACRAVDGGPDDVGDVTGACVVVLAEAWEAPTRELVNWLRELRRRVGTKRSIVVALVGEDGVRSRTPLAQDVALWRERLAELGDPYLFVDGGEVE